MASNIVDDNSDKTYFDLDSTLQAEKLEQEYNEQEFNSSQIPANQEIYEQLDQSLVNQPREIYIETLLKSTHENEGYLESYRRILYDRACSVEGFPK